MANIAAEITAHLNARHLHPTPTWLQSFISTTRPNTPLPALKQTALFRLLATDITTTLSQPQSSIFPRDILSGTAQLRYIPGPLIVQVLDISDIGHSKWSQVESIEAAERGETTKGREIVRVLPEDPQTQNQSVTQREQQLVQESKGPFKLLLQDAKGVKVWALDLGGVKGVGLSMAMGCKLVLRNCEVRRGVVLLDVGGTQVLGGKIEALDKVWKEGRKGRLIADVTAGSEDV